MKNLISMTAFLPEHPYSKFLKQPLEKWMFVPCDDDDGNVLEEPKEYNKWHMEEAYQQAKERCLFKGFECCNENDFYLTVYRQSDGASILIDKEQNTQTIENITNYDLELTETAIKRIVL
jgi:hypothetical protein